MGRRAKNKQAPPEPIEHKAALASKKQLGKRKAEPETQDEGRLASRPAKRVKDLNGKGKGKATSKPNAGKSSEKKKKVQFSQEDEGSDGWEDVEDDEDLKKHSKYFVIVYFC